MKAYSAVNALVLVDAYTFYHVDSPLRLVFSCKIFLMSNKSRVISARALKNWCNIHNGNAIAITTTMKSGIATCSYETCPYECEPAQRRDKKSRHNAMREAVIITQTTLDKFFNICVGLRIFGKIRNSFFVASLNSRLGTFGKIRNSFFVASLNSSLVPAPSCIYVRLNS